MKFKKIFIILLVLFVLAWMFLIFSFSSQNSSSSLRTSDKFLYKVVEVIKGHKLTAVERVRIKKKYVFFIRKCAHFFLYFILGGLIYVLLSIIIKSPIKPVILAILASFIYACTDEFHQLFVPGRTSAIFDIMVDTCGSMLAIALILFIKSFFSLILCIFRKKK